MTEFMLSIQFASRSPSRIIHLGCSLGILPMSLITEDSKPSFHSRVDMLMWPYKSSVGITLGLMSTVFTLFSGNLIFRAACNIFQDVDLPAPGGPMMKTQCLISSNSSSCITFSVKNGSGHSPLCSQAAETHSDKTSSKTRGGFNPGNKSFSKPKKTTSSACTIFGMLKSRSARIRRASSFSEGSARLSCPATTNTDLTARNPQS
mmetsp:Transcript_27012/g.37118  ORF Transcript_27012/g.37118 Transcript_27012/m.37118 type:complete len:205 (-) Transcript_27012:332-946(-)